MTCKVLIGLIFMSVLALSAPHHEGLISSLNIGARYSSLFQSRGVIQYRDFQVDPVLGIFFLDDRVEFLGDSIGYKEFVASDKLRLRTKLVSITDKPLFPSYESVRAGFIHREDTYEWSNRAELFLPGYNENYAGEIDFGIAKDLSVHHGVYIDLQLKLKLFDFKIPNLNTRIEPNFYSSIGWGNAAHNMYLYGPSANADEANNISYGLWLAFPEEADRYYPIILLSHFQSIGKNKDAEYARGRNEGWLFTFIATYGVLE